MAVSPNKVSLWQPFLLFTTCSHFLAGGRTPAGAPQASPTWLHPAFSSLCLTSPKICRGTADSSEVRQKAVFIKCRIIISNCAPSATKKIIWGWKEIFPSEGWRTVTGFMLTAQKLKEKKIKCLITMHESYPSFKTCSHIKYKLPHLFRYTVSHQGHFWCRNTHSSSWLWHYWSCFGNHLNSWGYRIPPAIAAVEIATVTKWHERRGCQNMPAPL